MNSNPEFRRRLMHALTLALPTFIVLPSLMVLGGFQTCREESEITWYTTCGDPVCSGYTGPFEGVPECTDEQDGDVCTSEGATCDPHDACNALLECTRDDPTAEGCPISRLKYKRDVHYLSAEEQGVAAGSALGMRLATWRYNWEADSATPHLGFVIDDVVGSRAVTPDGEHVDLYGYASITLAAVQEQQRLILAQQLEIAALRADVEALKVRR